MIETGKNKGATRRPTLRLPSLPPNELVLGLLAMRSELVNLPELEHCLVLQEGRDRGLDLGAIMVKQRYITRSERAYLHMILATDAELARSTVTLEDIEAEFRARMAELVPSVVVGEYEIEGELGRGGYGRVLAARNRQTGERVALKIISDTRTSVHDIERFKHEAAVLMSVDHPGVVRVRELSRERGLDFLVMDRVEGPTLWQLVATEGPLSPLRALGLARALAVALGSIHAKGIIHRDVKPENVKLGPGGTPVLLDFGLAGWDKLEVFGAWASIGSPFYQPPEQAFVGGAFGEIGPASDIYGLGAVLYFLLTGRRPLHATTREELRKMIVSVAPVAPSELDARIPAEVSELCLRCLRKRPEERFADAAELVATIDGIVGRIVARKRRACPPSPPLFERVALVLRRNAALLEKAVARVAHGARLTLLASPRARRGRCPGQERSQGCSIRRKNHARNRPSRRAPLLSLSEGHRRDLPRL